METEITIDELMGINIDLQKTVETRNQAINGLIDLNDELTKENTELKRQIKLFTIGEIEL